MLNERVVILGYTLTLLAACATLPDPVAEADAENCLYFSNIDDTSPYDDRHLYLETKQDKDFLLTLADACPAVEAKRLGQGRYGFRRRYGLLCSHNFPDVIINDSSTAGSYGVNNTYSSRQTRCPVSQVERIDSEEAGEAIAERRSAVYQLADDFADAWNAGEAASVAAMFAYSASLSIDEADSVEGREAIEAAIGRLMATTPELHVAQSDIDDEAESITLSWSWSEAIPQRDDDPVIAGRQVWQLSADAEIESATIRTRAERGD